MQTAVDLAAGIGVAIVTGSLRNLRRSGVVYKTLQDPSPVIDIDVVWPRSDDGPVLRSFLNVVGKVSNEVTVRELAGAI